MPISREEFDAGKIHPLRPLARKLARSWCYVTVHFDATLPKTGNDAECTVCNSREQEILVALRDAVNDEREACADLARDFSELDNGEPGCATAFGEDQNCCTESLADAIQERGT